MDYDPGADLASEKQVPGVFPWPKEAGSEGWRHRHLSAYCLENVGAPMSHNPMGLHGLLQGWEKVSTDNSFPSL
jgi:hypothetical protein